MKDIDEIVEIYFLQIIFVYIFNVGVRQNIIIHINNQIKTYNKWKYHTTNNYLFYNKTSNAHYAQFQINK